LSAVATACGWVRASAPPLAAGLETRAGEARADGAPLGRLSIDHVVDLTHALGPSTPLLLPLLPKFALINLASHEPTASMRTSSWSTSTMARISMPL
jgi:hypothetical protein